MDFTGVFFFTRTTFARFQGRNQDLLAGKTLFSLSCDVIETVSRHERGGPGRGPDGHLRGSKGLLHPRGEAAPNRISICSSTGPICS